jgi:hypothetical protein
MSVSINKLVDLGKLYMQFLFFCIQSQIIQINLNRILYNDVQISVLCNWDECCLSYYNYGMSAVKNHDGSSVDDTNCIETTSSLWFTSTKIKY